MYYCVFDKKNLPTMNGILNNNNINCIVIPVNKLLTTPYNNCIASHRYSVERQHCIIKTSTYILSINVT